MLKVFCPTGEGGGIDPTCSPGGNRTSIDDQESVDIVKIEDQLLANNSDKNVFRHEEAVILDNDSKVRHWIPGETNSVKIPEEVMQESRFEGNWVLTHNHPNDATHPNGGSLSRGDLKAAKEMNLYEMRAVAKGPLGKFTFSVKRPQRGWPSTEVLLYTYEKHLSDLTNHFAKRGAKISNNAINLAFSHAIMTMTAKQLKLDYKMTRDVARR